jgi:drug/metabolite transporter (DMT)-like permease
MTEPDSKKPASIFTISASGLAPENSLDGDQPTGTNVQYGDLEREIGFTHESDQLLELLPSSPTNTTDTHHRIHDFQSPQSLRRAGASSIRHKYYQFKKTPLRVRLHNIWHSIIYSYLGVKLLLLSQFFNAGMAATTRLLETTSDPPFHPLQILFVRMTITYAGCFAFMYWKRIPDFVIGPPGVRLLLILRGTVGFFGVFGLYYSVNYLELSDATVITFLTPTMAAILAWFFLGEKLIPAELAGGFVALLGVLLIARPAFIIHWIQGNSHVHSGEPDDIPEYLRMRAIFFALLGVFGAGMAFVSIRWIGKRAHPLISVSYFAAWCVLVSTVGLILIPGLSFVLPQNAYQWMLLFALGICGFLMQFSLTAGIQRVKAGRAAAATYTQILWAIMWERLIWHKLPDLLSLFGGSLIIGSAITVSLIKYRQTKKDEEELAKQNEDDDGAIMFSSDDDECPDSEVQFDHARRVIEFDNVDTSSRESTSYPKQTSTEQEPLKPFDNGFIDGGPLLGNENSHSREIVDR